MIIQMGTTVDKDAQRQALADRIRRDHQRSVQRKRIWTVVVVLIGVMGCLAAMVWFHDGPAEADVLAPNNATQGYGFTVTSELLDGSGASSGVPIDVAIYEDFLCPSCKIFHEETGEFLDEQVRAGTISLTYHPFAFLLTKSTDEYTQRAANAAVCVGDQAGALGYAAMHRTLMDRQPAQGGPGLPDAELIALAAQAGAGDVSECVAERTFQPWIQEALRVGKESGVRTTPTVRVAGVTVVRSNNGNESIPGPDEIQFAIEALQ